MLKKKKKKLIAGFAQRLVYDRNKLILLLATKENYSKAREDETGY